LPKDIAMARIPPVAPEDLSPEMAEIYRTHPSGRLNIFRLHCHAPTCFPAYSNLAKAIFAELDVPPLERELVVLVVAVLQDCEYEWAQHAQIAAGMGIPQAHIDAIRAGDFTSAIFNARETALFEFTRQTVQNVRVDDPAYDAVAAFYSHRQIIELLYTIGSYMMLARIMEVAEIELDAVHGAEIVKHAEAQQAAKRS
jgi:AhpD family alkylhydroperoxidase